MYLLFRVQCEWLHRKLNFKILKGKISVEVTTAQGSGWSSSKRKGTVPCDQLFENAGLEGIAGAEFYAQIFFSWIPFTQKQVFEEELLPKASCAVSSLFLTIDRKEC